MRLFGPCAALLLALPLPASASTITFSFSGTVTFRDAVLAAAFPMGQAASGSFQLDSATPDTGSGASFGNYSGVSNISTLFGSYLGSAAGGTSQEALLIINDQGGFDEFDLTIQPFSGADVGSFQLLRLQLDLEDQQAAAFSSDAIPSALDLMAFEARSLALIFTDGVSFVLVAATLDSFDITVPEPGVLGLLAVGAAALVALGPRS